MTKIIDCFIFYNELKMLKLRLTELYDTVDYFIIVEAKHTFKGNEKELLFEMNKEQYKEFLPKIIHLVVDNMPNTHNAWDNEHYQRRYIDNGIKSLNLNDDDIIIISDCDEIPDTNTLNTIRNSDVNNMYSLEMDFYYYDYTCKFTNKWYHPKILPYSVYKMYNNPQKIRMSSNCNSIKKGGWHLSYFGDINFIKNKVKNFAHQEYNNDNILNDKHLTESIEKGKVFFPYNQSSIVKINISDNKYLPKNYKILL
jgi:beta-1,4-mannosyl-glycoprotein beta-1,4-N-acetylglucosaminyltransferase